MVPSRANGTKRGVPMSNVAVPERSTVQQAVNLVRQMSREELEELIRQVPALQQVKSQGKSKRAKARVMRFAGSWSDLSREQLAILDEVCQRREPFFEKNAGDRTW
jgi:hypothetical protein